MKRYQCTTCGKISESEKDICQTAEVVSSVYICSECNKKGTVTDNICNPVEMKPEFFCGTCGTSSVEKKSLCKPQAL